MPNLFRVIGAMEAIANGLNLLRGSFRWAGRWSEQPQRSRDIRGFFVELRLVDHAPVWDANG